MIDYSSRIIVFFPKDHIEMLNCGFYFSHNKLKCIFTWLGHCCVSSETGFSHVAVRFFLVKTYFITQDLSAKGYEFLALVYIWLFPKCLIT